MTSTDHAAEYSVYRNGGFVLLSYAQFPGIVFICQSEGGDQCESCMVPGATSMLSMARIWF